MNKEILKNALERLAKTQSDDFDTLVRLAGLDPSKDFRYTDLSGVDLKNSTLYGYDFTGAKFNGADLRSTKFINCKTDNIEIRFARVHGSSGIEKHIDRGSFTHILDRAYEEYQKISDERAENTLRELVRWIDQCEKDDDALDFIDRILNFMFSYRDLSDHEFMIFALKSIDSSMDVPRFPTATCRLKHVIGQISARVGDIKWAEKYWNDAVSILYVNHQEQYAPPILIELAGSYFEHGNYDLSEEVLKQAIEYSINSSSNQDLAAASSFLAYFLSNLERFDEALEQINDTVGLWGYLGVYENQTQLLLEGSRIYFYKKNNPNMAFHYAHEALTLSEAYNLVSSTYDVYSHIGLMHYHAADNNEALFYLNKALHVHRDCERHDETSLFGVLGVLYERIGSYTRARELYEYCLHVHEMEEDASKISHDLEHLGNVCQQLGEYDNAIKYLSRCAELYYAQDNQKKYEEICVKIESLD